MVKARLIIKGNVQGVGYRALVKLFARRMGVKGLVRNLEDGSVELFVDGSKQAIEELSKRICVKGRPEDPLSLHMDSLDLYWEGMQGYQPAWREYAGFEIDYGVEELRCAEKEMLDSLEWSKLHFTGMSRVFREELGGVKGELKETHTDIKEMHKNLKDAIGDMHRDLKEDTVGIKGAIVEMHKDLKDEMVGVRGEVSGMHKDLGDKMAEVSSEIKDMHVDMNKSFDEMAKRYDAISSELVRTREELTRAVSGLLKLIEEFIQERRGAGRPEHKE